MHTQSDQVSISINAPEQKENTDLVSDEKFIKLYDEVLDDIRQDSVCVHDVFDRFYEMVINGGDATSSSKEALVNLLKIKSELADKKTRIIDLLGRIKQKDRDTFPRYLVANQKNTIVNGKIDQKKLLEELSNEQKE